MQKTEILVNLNFFCRAFLWCSRSKEKENEGKESKGPQIKNSWLNICFHIKKKIYTREKEGTASGISRKKGFANAEQRKINIYSLWENLFSKITSRGNKKIHTARDCASKVNCFPITSTTHCWCKALLFLRSNKWIISAYHFPKKKSSTMSISEQTLIREEKRSQESWHKFPSEDWNETWWGNLLEIVIWYCICINFINKFSARAQNRFARCVEITVEGDVLRAIKERFDGKKRVPAKKLYSQKTDEINKLILNRKRKEIVLDFQPNRQMSRNCPSEKKVFDFKIGVNIKYHINDSFKSRYRVVSSLRKKLADL